MKITIFIAWRATAALRRCAYDASRPSAKRTSCATERFHSRHLGKAQPEYLPRQGCPWLRACSRDLLRHTGQTSDTVRYIFATAAVADRTLIVGSSTMRYVPMKRFLLPLAAIVVLSSGVALAADRPPSTSPRAVCRADVEKFCSGIRPGGGRIAGCLKQNEAQVSAICKDAIAKARERKAPSTSGASPG